MNAALDTFRTCRGLAPVMASPPKSYYSEKSVSRHEVMVLFVILPHTVEVFGTKLACVEEMKIKIAFCPRSKSHQYIVLLSNKIFPMDCLMKFVRGQGSARIHKVFLHSNLKIEL
jgi:hypothetical protein